MTVCPRLARHVLCVSHGLGGSGDSAPRFQGAEHGKGRSYMALSLCWVLGKLVSLSLSLPVGKQAQV